MHSRAFHSRAHPPTSAPFEGGAWGIRTAEGAYVGWPVEGSRSTLHFLLGQPSQHSYDVELEVDAEPGDLAPTDIRLEGGKTDHDPIRLAAGESAVLRYRVRPKARGRDSWISLDLFEAPIAPDARTRACGSNAPAFSSTRVRGAGGPRCRPLSRPQEILCSKTTEAQGMIPLRSVIRDSSPASERICPTR